MRFLRFLRSNFFVYGFSIFALCFSLLTLINTIQNSNAAPVKPPVSREKYTVRHYHSYTNGVTEYQAKDLWLYGGAMTIKKANGKDTVLLGGVVIADEN